MTEAQVFYMDGDPRDPEPLHYTACGLDDVYLLNGFRREETPYGDTITVHNVDGLHEMIGISLVLERKSLKPRDIRFLRKQMDLTQVELAQKLLVTTQTVARWEKDQCAISGPADRLLRVLYVFSLLSEEQRQEMLEELRVHMDSFDQQDDVRDRKFVFEATPSGWRDRIAA